jgi:hypothetical protein
MYILLPQCLPRIPQVYKLKYYDWELIEGSFYEQELQKLQLGKDKVFHVEEILDQKREKGPKNGCWSAGKTGPKSSTVGY